MAKCSSPVPESIEVSLLEVGDDLVVYVISSFPANLRHIKYTRRIDNTGTTIYDGFMEYESFLVGKNTPP